MREAPKQFEEYSVMGLDLPGAATADTRFDMLCETHGDGDSYTWISGGGERTYSLLRGEIKGWADNTYPMRAWRLNIASIDGSTYELTVDCFNVKIFDTDGSESTHQSANEVYRAVVDAAYELEENDKSIRHFILPNGIVCPNPNYRP